VVDAKKEMGVEIETEVEVPKVIRKVEAEVEVETEMEVGMMEKRADSKNETNIQTQAERKIRDENAQTATACLLVMVLDLREKERVPREAEVVMTEIESTIIAGRYVRMFHSMPIPIDLTFAKLIPS
jgi:hypothetical protein